MNGSASTTWRKLRSSSEPSSQNAISSAANGLGARFIVSAVAAPARLEMARPARMRSSRLALRPATTSSRNTEVKAATMAASGSTNERTSARPSAITSDRAEGGRLRRAEQRGRGERIAQQPLQGGAGKPEHRADREAEHRARQPDLLHDDAVRLGAARRTAPARPSRARAAPSRCRARAGTAGPPAPTTRQASERGTSSPVARLTK